MFLQNLEFILRTRVFSFTDIFFEFYSKETTRNNVFLSAELTNVTML